MRQCPYCNQRAITYTQKWHLAFSKGTQCGNCGMLVSVKTGGVAVSTVILLIGTIAATIVRFSSYRIVAHVIHLPDFIFLASGIIAWAYYSFMVPLVPRDS